MNIDEPFIFIRWSGPIYEYKLNSIRLEVAPHSQAEYAFSAPAFYFPQGRDNNYVQLKYVDSEGVERLIGNKKYVYVKKTSPTITFRMPNLGEGNLLKNGDPFEYSLRVSQPHELDPGPFDVKISEYYDAYNPATKQYERHENQVYKGSVSLSSDTHEFTVSGSYQSSFRKLQSYRLKMELDNQVYKNNVEVIDFSRVHANVNVTMPELAGAVQMDDEACLKAEDTYKIKFKLKNDGPFLLNIVKDCIIILSSSGKGRIF